MSITVTRLVRATPVGNVAWHALPPLAISQGGTIALASYIDNPNFVPVTYALHAGTLPSGVTLNAASGILTASGVATLGSVSGLSFDVLFFTSILTSTTTTLLVSAPAQTGAVTMSVATYPYTGSARILMSAKHLNWARLQNPLNTNEYRWYKLCGDHSATNDPLDAAFPPQNYTSFDGGRQEVLSLNAVTNDWREDTPYFLPASYGVQGADPDDAGCFAVGTEAWVFNSATNRGVIQPTGAATQIDLLAFICAYTPPSATWPLGHWRVVCPRPQELNGNRAWRGFYDPVKNRVVIPWSNGSMQLITIDVANPNAAYTSTNLGVNGFFITAGLALDLVGRKLYLYDIDGGANGGIPSLWQIDIDTFARSKVTNIPEQPVNTQSAVKMTWHPGLRAVVLNIVKTWVYQVDSSRLTSFTRQDGYVNAVGTLVPSSDTQYDPDTGDVLCLGSEDFDPLGGPAPGNFYWRQTFTAASTGLPSWVPALNTVGVITTSGINLVDPIIDMPLPHQWDTGTGSNRAVYDNWGNGCYSPDYGTFGAMMVAGGGHDGYWGNDVYLLDLNLPDATRKWARIIDPSRRCGNDGIATFDEVHGEFDDGTPGVPHLYGAASYLPPSMGGGNKGSFIMPMATYWRGLRTTGYSHRADLETRTWIRSSANACNNQQESTWAFDSSRQRFIGGRVSSSTVLNILGSFASGVGTHSDAPMSGGFTMGSDPSSEYAPAQDAFLMLGSFLDGPLVGRFGIRAWDLANYVPYDLTITGPFPAAQGGCGFAWVAPLGAFYILSPAPGSEQILYKLVPPTGNWRTGTWTCTQITMAGVACVGSEINGMWNRFRYAPALKCLVWSQTYSGATYAYRVVT